MSLSNQLRKLPCLVVHADWSVNPRKRVMARANIDSQGIYHIASPEMLGDRHNIEPEESVIRQVEGWIFGQILPQDHV